MAQGARNGFLQFLELRKSTTAPNTGKYTSNRKTAEICEKKLPAISSWCQLTCAFKTRSRGGNHMRVLTCLMRIQQLFEIAFCDFGQTSKTMKEKKRAESMQLTLRFGIFNVLGVGDPSPCSWGR